MDGSGIERGSDFNSSQRMVACGLLRSISAIREDTLDTDISDRQSHLLILLGMRTLKEDQGETLDTMTVTRLRKLIEEQFDVSDVTAADDISSLKEKGLIDQKVCENDKRAREVFLTDVGFAVFDELSERMACLVLTFAREIENRGPVPLTPFERIKDFVSGFLKNSRVTTMIVTALVVCAISFGAAFYPDVALADVKGFYDEGLTSPRALIIIK